MPVGIEFLGWATFQFITDGGTKILTNPFLGIGGIRSKGQFLTELYPDEAAIATKWLKVRAVIPMHYLRNEADVFEQELIQQAPGVDLVVMKPGERLRFSRTKGLIH